MSPAALLLWGTVTAAPPPPAPPTLQPFHERVYWHIPGSLGDGVSTEWALSRGGSEFNPLLQSRGLRLAVRVAEPLLLAAVENGIERKIGRRPALWFRWFAIVSRLAVTFWNIRTGLAVSSSERR